MLLFWLLVCLAMKAGLCWILEWMAEFEIQVEDLVRW